MQKLGENNAKKYHEILKRHIKLEYMMVCRESWNFNFFCHLFGPAFTHCVAAAGWEALDTNYRGKGFMVDLPLLDGCKKILMIFIKVGRTIICDVLKCM